MDISGTAVVGTIRVILYLNHPHSRNQATVTLPDTYAINLHWLISWIMPFCGCGVHRPRVVVAAMVVVDCQWAMIGKIYRFLF